MNAPPLTRRRLMGLYVAMVAGGAAAFLAVRELGRGLTPTASHVVGPETGHTGPSDPMLHVIVALLAILATSRLLSALCRRIKQPPVMGEVLAGILLGPSLLGHLAPTAFHGLFPASVNPSLYVLSQLGVILFMFLVGLELNESLLAEETHVTVAIAHASIVAPFVLGSALALWLYPLMATQGTSFTAFTLFLGASMAVTAFPVLARILGDRGLQNTPLGTLALTCAAVDDATAWCLLAFVVGVARSEMAGAALTLGLTALYVAVMFLLVRPLARRLVARIKVEDADSQGVLATALGAVLISALGTHLIGIHALFGAFMAGAAIPHDSPVALALRRRLEGLVIVVLLPAFFAFTGLRTEIGLIHGSQWLICAAIVGVACLGKVGGTAVAARVAGLTWRDSASLGVLMNTRGLMGLIVLNLGLDLGVISPTLFAMLVITAVVTTFATTPLLDVLRRWPAGAAAGKVAVSIPNARSTR